MLRVEMLCTGDEVLHGQIVDTNAAWLADYLFQQGAPMASRMTVGDELDALVTALTERSHVADVLIVNGGLGPTSDDLSSLAAATAADVSLVEHSAWLAKMTAYFADRGRPMSSLNRKQALIPDGAELLDNPIGTACGFALKLNRCMLFFTPGVPSEFKVMVDQQIMPRLRQRFTLGEAPLCLRLTTFGRGESDLASALAPLILPPGVVLGYRCAVPIVEIKLTGPASQQHAMQTLWRQVKAIVGDSMVFEGTAGLPVQLAQTLSERQLRLAVAEEFTAGLLHWQLRGANAPLAGGELSTASPVISNTLAAVAQQARELAQRRSAQMALVVGGLGEGRLSLALHTPSQTLAQTLRFNAARYALSTQQEIVAMAAMNMLRRWSSGVSPYGGNGWIETLETL
ncbi:MULTISPECIES: nicotinamide mononucleotide deamidase-related protein YfaY [Lonsdalea]|uniref:Competence/damage-inducible protein A n=2 Tax=Lonsdalea TaxID=1082702 RepID=A0ACD1JEY0_9GAMM|nr:MULTISPECIES: nicotinamide mononucleotide deamidase-related protein YfaY [Lonsdalea]OSM96326.1 competence/damage-inducible protein A [Lonsdalea populi]OSN01131.1 competence/damage-inducible protein A [Lonsdalea populi]QPQ25163.1 nicotinamide mononucleotide deamidase-related protein YfaY [Lonsdalea populi]RAT15398.1 competence/damage-inducible protein A [Lonsdalea quercina]RAT17521.1 competence/damage-inducible protein A [Lonsdalea quercina]